MKHGDIRNRPDSPFASARGLSIGGAVATIALAASSAFPQSGGGYEITRRSVGSPGTTFQVGGGYRLGSTIGRPDIGEASGGGYEVLGGFWTRQTQPVIIDWDPDPLAPTRSTNSPAPIVSDAPRSSKRP